ncbi:hypothetical protein RHGRI_026020 [Rhododendron griersonianum]|uniref:F-box protein n=1 Tax=Rhododendron griersonianum TaxID=479676 RepID=A0AAV6ITK3_9ERIC|nr:hypothetical protein RHGRI_026020 [Rhododendron griersonianum]
MDNFSVLPEGCISLILSMTSPRDACRWSAISSGFDAAANSDSVWEKFLPSDYRQIISRSVSPVVFSTKKQLYFSLCDSPLLLDSGKLSFALDRESGKKCYTLPAWEVDIAWKDDSRYWKWISLPESRRNGVTPPSNHLLVPCCHATCPTYLTLPDFLFKSGGSVVDGSTNRYSRAMFELLSRYRLVWRNVAKQKDISENG